MMNEPVRRVLVLAEPVTVTADLLDAMRERAVTGPTQFRVVVPNPAPAEIHLLHPERHVKAAEAEHALRSSMAALEAAAGGPVIGSVSVRHDPMDVVEDVLFNEPIDEIIVTITGHKLRHWLHQDLQERLHHHGLPVTTITPRATV